MKRGIRYGLLWAVLFVCAFLGLAVAQLIMGSLTGIVTDPAGAVVPGVTVTAKNTATGVISQTRSSATSNYVIPALPPGTYQLEVTAGGFKTWVRGNIVLFAGDNLRLDPNLQVGTQQERVEVTAEAPVLK